MKWHILINSVNLLFNGLVIASVLTKTTIDEVQLVVQIAVDIWVGFLLIYLSFTLYRLIKYTK